MLYIALPILDELDYLPALLSCFKQQTYTNFIIVACVNQPDAWWLDDEKKAICLRNQQCIQLLNNSASNPIHLIDKSSPGNGWQGKQRGIGWARKLIMDHINSNATEKDIILSLDADCTFSSIYFQSIVDVFTQNPKAIGLANPYYHPLTTNENQNRAILRYEIYMRFYALNMFRINNPYAFTALGSAIALPVWGYRKISGIAPKYAGEDFYFLQQLTKAGVVLHWNKETVLPSGRLSSRVDVGTGPALRKGIENIWNSYPIYPYQLFDDVEKTYSLFPDLFYKDLETPLTIFLQTQLNTIELWQGFRTNNKDIPHFIKACTERLDGLRILQYLKSNHIQEDETDTQNLILFLNTFYPEHVFKSVNFQHSSNEELNTLRDYLCNIESYLRKKKP